MSTTRNVLRICDERSREFADEFALYLDYLDKLLSMQSAVGFERDELVALPELVQDLVKAYLFLAESGNTTMIAALRLLSGNLHGDAMGLVRILYEIACIMHYGNMSRDNKQEVMTTLFKSGLAGREQSKSEWALTRKALAQCKEEKPDLEDVVGFLNNYGAHISREKVVLGNVTAMGDTSASTAFTSNFRKKRFLVGLEFLYHISAMIQEEYVKHVEQLGGTSMGRHKEIAELGKRFLVHVRPRLLARMADE